MFVPHEMGAAGAPRPVRHFVLDASAISGINASAVEAIRAVHGGPKVRNIALEGARTIADLRA